MSQQLILSYLAVKTGCPISKLILLKLADNSDSHCVCFPYCEYLAQYCEISLRTVKSHLNTLGKMDLLKEFNALMKKGDSEATRINCAYPITDK